MILVNQTQLDVPSDFDVSVAYSTFHQFEHVNSTIDFHFCYLLVYIMFRMHELRKQIS